MNQQQRIELAKEMRRQVNNSKKPIGRMATNSITRMLILFCLILGSLSLTVIAGRAVISATKPDFKSIEEESDKLNEKLLDHELKEFGLTRKDIGREKK
jgi:hypothetical protein